MACRGGTRHRSRNRKGFAAFSGSVRRGEITWPYARPSVLATTGKPPVTLTGSSPSAATAAVTAPRGRLGVNRPAGAPGPAAGTSAPGYFKMLTARATISATVMMEMTDCRAMASFAQRDSGITSVGLNADALVNAR